MRTFLHFAILSAIALPALALPSDAIDLPEPGILSLVGFGVAAIVATYRRKK